MRTEPVTFANSAGHLLSGRLDRPLVAPSAYAIFAHCFTCGKNLKAAVNIARALTAAGFAVLRFDFTGVGESEGDEHFADWASVLFEQALLAEGGQLEDPAGFVRRMNGLMLAITSH